MKKIIISFLHLIQILVLIAFRIIHYFTTTKMGMARHMVYFGRKVEAYNIFSVPIVNIIYIILILGVIILNIRLFIEREKSRFLNFEHTIFLIYSIVSILALIFAKRELERDYYVNMISHSIVLFIYIIILVTLWWNKNGKEK
jgi:hypothetical protein